MLSGEDDVEIVGLSTSEHGSKHLEILSVLVGLVVVEYPRFVGGHEFVLLINGVADLAEYEPLNLWERCGALSHPLEGGEYVDEEFFEGDAIVVHSTSISEVDEIGSLKPDFGVFICYQFNQAVEAGEI